MNNFKVPVTKILNVKNHPGADALDICTVYGFQVIARKGSFKQGDVVVYAPVDSILSAKVESIVFPPDSKVKLHKGRVRQIRLRGLASQGLLIQPSEIMPLIADYAKSKGLSEITIEPEQDLAEILGITKYDPDPPQEQKAQQKRDKPKENPLLHKYNGLDNIKWQPDFFEGQTVVVQEKLHGTNARYGVLPNKANTLWKKILNFFGMLPKTEFCYGSNNVQLQTRGFNPNTNFFSENVYGKMIDQYSLRKLPLGYTVYGEIIGPGIQNNYHYDIPQGQHKLVIFDVKHYDGENTRYLNVDEVKDFANKHSLEMVPELYRGPYDLEKIREMTKGNSVYAPGQKVREGVVIKSLIGYNDEYHGKKARKLISEDYLADAKNTDNH